MMMMMVMMGIAMIIALRPGTARMVTKVDAAEATEQQSHHHPCIDNNGADESRVGRHDLDHSHSNSPGPWPHLLLSYSYSYSSCY